jgi:hypothetical protein
MGIMTKSATSDRPIKYQPATFLTGVIGEFVSGRRRLISG